MRVPFCPSNCAYSKSESFAQKTVQSFGKENNMAQALAQQLPTSETQVLRMLSQGAPMMEVLNELCNFIDAKSPGVIPTVLLSDDDGTYLRLAAGPKVPEIWAATFDRLKLPSYTVSPAPPDTREKLFRLPTCEAIRRLRIAGIRRLVRAFKRHGPCLFCRKTKKS